MSLTPGAELAAFFSSTRPRSEGSCNLVRRRRSRHRPLARPHRRSQIARGTRTPPRAALDRVLRAGHYWVPQWYKASHTIAIWDKFGRPAAKPAYDRGILDTWWIDAEKVKKLKQN